jgi:hypothetical protein
MSFSCLGFALLIYLCAGSSSIPSSDTEGCYQWEVHTQDGWAPILGGSIGIDCCWGQCLRARCHLCIVECIASASTFIISLQNSMYRNLNSNCNIFIFRTLNSWFICVYLWILTSPRTLWHDLVWHPYFCNGGVTGGGKGTPVDEASKDSCMEQLSELKQLKLQRKIDKLKKKLKDYRSRQLTSSSSTTLLSLTMITCFPVAPSLRYPLVKPPILMGQTIPNGDTRSRCI